MVDSLVAARNYVEKLRFRADLPSANIKTSGFAFDIREKLYQNAIEISSALTPILWKRVGVVCDRLRMPQASISAFIYSSPEVQAECLGGLKNHCVVRFSSALVDLLSEEEFEFVIGHEVAHFLLDHKAIASDQFNAEAFLRQRAQEISADRVGLVACSSLETALRALMKTVSGLTERHLRFDVAAFISQLKKIEGAIPDWSGSTHPSILIRSKALIWLSMTEKSAAGNVNWPVDQIRLLDQRVERDLNRFVDGALKKQIADTKRDLMLWMIAFEILQLGAFSKRTQMEMRTIFDDQTIDRLLLFMEGCSRDELETIFHEKISATRALLESLIPQSFISEMSELQLNVETKLREFVQ